MKPSETADTIRKACARLQLTEVGFVGLPLPAGLAESLTEAEPSPFTPPDPHLRTRPEELLPGARAVIVLLFPYRAPTDTPLPEHPPYTETGGANIARYARPRDYHRICKQYLERLQARLQVQLPEEAFYPFVDTSPLPDRYLAYAAGIGYFGRNHCLINDRYGTYTVIGGLVTTAELPPSEPLTRSCLGCNRCRRYCPGQALRADGFTYRRCKSYLTQKKGEFSPTEAEILQRTPTVFGCDVCQDVCPHNRTAEPSPLPEFAADRLDRITAAELAAYSNTAFRKQFADRAWAWRGKQILLRNLACLAAKKERTAEDIPD